MPPPPPNTVPYNDWRLAPAPGPGDFIPSRPVSVIVSYYDAPDALALTLAALEGQTYPRQLFEVVIVDDGSPTPLAAPQSTPLNVRVVRQERRGFGLARGRNTGVRAAAHDILLFLDGDLLAEAGWIAAHARWHHTLSDVLTIGFYAYAAVDGIDAAAIRRRPGSLRELFADRPTDPPWIERHMRMTGCLTTRDDDPFRLVGGGNCGVSRAFYELVGGYDDSFAGWGGEDVEFAYRAYTHGGLLAPARDAFAWHQGRLREGWAAKWQSGEVQHAKAAHLIAHPRFRYAAPGRTFSVPQFVVTVSQEGLPAGGIPADLLFEAAALILADRAYDLVVRVEIGEDDAGFAWLQQQLGPDPRVRIGPAGSAVDEFPVAAFQVVVPASAAFRVNLVHRLRQKLGTAVTAGATLSDGTTVSITRTWAIHRARRTGKSPADFGDAVTLSPRSIGLTAGRRRGVNGAAVRTGSWNYRSRREWLRVAVRRIDGPAAAVRFLEWLGRRAAQQAAGWFRRRFIRGKGTPAR